MARTAAIPTRPTISTRFEESSRNKNAREYLHVAIEFTMGELIKNIAKICLAKTIFEISITIALKFVSGGAHLTVVNAYSTCPSTKAAKRAASSPVDSCVEISDCGHASTKNSHRVVLSLFYSLSIRKATPSLRTFWGPFRPTVSAWVSICDIELANTTSDAKRTTTITEIVRVENLKGRPLAFSHIVLQHCCSTLSQDDLFGYPSTLFGSVCIDGNLTNDQWSSMMWFSRHIRTSHRSNCGDSLFSK